jgi:hypothetical protein
MKITDPDVIQNGEKGLIEAVKKDLDWDAIREIIKKKMSATFLEPKGGQIVVHNNEIAFQIDFDISLSDSLMFDRDGNHIADYGNVEDERNSKDASDTKEFEDSINGQALNDIGDEDIDDVVNEDIIDNDINDILQESREFWKQKKRRIKTFPTTKV